MKDYVVMIIDAYGREIYRSACDTGSKQIDVHGFIPGIYIVKLQAPGMTLLKKLVIR
jgi:hypothetical protein